MKKYLIVILIIISAGCSNVKSIYRNNTLDINNRSIVQILEKNNGKENNKSIIYFTSGFDGDTIELINGSKTLFKLPIKTINQIGLANLETVLNDQEVKINILSARPVWFILNKEKLKTSKFIYISKEIFKNNKYVVEYSNLKKDFL